MYKLMPMLFSFSAMNRVAALSSDKEQLEHLCARLQVRVLTEILADFCCLIVIYIVLS